MNNPLYVAYHDEGTPSTTYLQSLLSCAQAGDPSGWSFLGKRCSINAKPSKAFLMHTKFKRSQMSDEELEAFDDNPAIIRNRAKIFATRGPTLRPFYKFR